jgi:probable rRNA maturation factor
MVRSARRIQVVVQVHTTFPRSYARAVSQAVRSTIQLVPTSVWKLYSRDAMSSIAVSIVTERAIAKLNADFRSKPKPTDVLSFPSAPTPGSGFLGDVLICWKVAKKQTTDFGTTPRAEVQRLTVHGVLHLLGYDHETSESDAKRMFQLQNKVLKFLERNR